MARASEFPNMHSGDVVLKASAAADGAADDGAARFGVSGSNNAFSILAG